ncbi:non-hydrolyzing UDP-N-acetylglucosamine 2-epimerase [Actinomycetospora rhizophila]|uniref:Non-hydrolyzing UDP-N-acetylglucosamine 2-epimerase n=1 Tax=Actinomycetospora rhizophila TaxID=1416876 RepID=A0ABV9ZP14_9PSEU
MRIVSVVGARPQFVKLAPVAEAVASVGEHIIVHTGQHYDPRMSDVFFADLEIPQPDVHLGIGSGSHGAQTGAMLAALEPVLVEQKPDWVLVYGDTNSTLAAALAAVKQHLPVAHLEAGLRSFNRRMPEEHNRVLTDHAADLLLAPTARACAHLAQEGLADRTVEVGDVMTDVCLRVRDAVADGPLPSSIADVPPGFVLSTLHRAENTDDPARLDALLAGLAAVSAPVVLAAHPRLRAKTEAYGLPLERPGLHIVDPLPYPALVRAVLASSAVVTDSGGLQKESFLLRRKCTTMRPETEWPETVELGWNALCDDPAALPSVVERPDPAATTVAPYGTGTAARRVAEVLAAR